MTFSLTPNPEPQPNVPSPGGESIPAKKDEKSRQMPQPSIIPLEASGPLLQDKKVVPVDFSAGQADLATEVSAKEVGQKVLMPFKKTDSHEVKLKKLTKQIETINDSEKDWPYRLERARLSNDIDVRLADLAHVEKHLKTPDVYNLLAKAFWLKNDWGNAFLTIEKRKIARDALKGQILDKSIVTEKDFVPLELLLLKDLLHTDPEFSEAWQSKDTPPEWRAVLIKGYQQIVEEYFASDKHQKTLTDPKLKGDVYRYLKGGLNRLHRMYKELALVTNYDVEKLWLKMKGKDLQVVDRLIDRMLDFVISADGENRQELLNTCISIAEYDHSPDTINSFAKAFAVLKKVYPSNPALVLKAMETLNYAGSFSMLLDLAQEENVDSKGKKLFDLKEPLSIGDVISRMVLTADRLEQASLEFRAETIFGFSAKIYNDIFKIAAELGSDTTAQLIDKHVETLPRDFLVDEIIGPKRIGTLKAILEAEKKWDIDLLSMFIQNPKWMNYFIGNEDLFCKYSSVWKLTKSTIIESRFKQMEIVKEIIDFTHDYPDVCIWLLKDDCPFDQSVTNSEAAWLVQFILKYQNEPNFKERLHIMLNMLQVSPEQGKVAIEISKIDNSEFRNRMLDLIGNGEIKLATDLVRLSKIPHAKSEPLIKNLLANTSIETASMANSLLQLKKTKHPIVKWVETQPSDQIFAPLSAALLILHAQGDEELLPVVLSMAEKREDERTVHEKTILKWVENGFYSLARDFLKNGKEDFWQNMISLNLPSHKIQMLRNLNVSLAALTHFTPREAAFIESVALKLVSEPNKDVEQLANEWLSLFQLISNDPKVIEKIRNSPNWDIAKEILTSDVATNPTYYMQVIGSLPGWTKLPNLRNEKTFAGVANSIAKAVVTPSGGINTHLIPYIIKQLETLMNKSSTPHYHREHLLFVLKQLQQEHYFGDRLEKLGLPPKNSSQHRLLVSLCGANYTVQDVRAATLGALLTPLRQGAVGSCFGTAIAIQMSSSPDGLKQSFEDFLSIITHGSLTRKNPSTNISVSYPMIYDSERFKALFPYDNHLMRVREFTISSMGGESWKAARKGAERGGLLMQRVNPAFLNRLGKFKGSLSPLERDAWNKLEAKIPSIDKLFSDTLLSNMACRYLGFVKRAGTNEAGGWAIVDTRTEEPLIASRANLENLFLFCLQEVKKQIPQVLDSNEKRLIEKLFDEQLPHDIRSDQFLIDILGIAMGQIPTFFGFDRSEIRNNALTITGGGDERYVLQTYHKGVVASRNILPEHAHPLQRLSQYINRMSPKERDEASSNPHLLVPMFAPGHTMNLKIGTIVSYFTKSTPEAMVADISQKNAALMAIPLEGSLQDNIIEAFYKQCDEALLRSLKAPLEKAIKARPPKTVKDLCRQILRASILISSTDDKAKQKAVARLKSAISGIDVLKAKIPPLIDVIDTNWERTQGMSFSFDFDGAFRDPVFTTYLNGIEASPTFEYPVNTWEIYRARYAIDDFSRSYCLATRDA